jgi:hyperosmotically inducible periplasmic protein
MKTTSIKPNQITKALSLAVCLGAMPLIGLVTGCAGDRYHQSTGEAIDDRGVSMRVKSALSDDTQYKYDEVSVKTFKGTVQLSGFVDTSAQKSRAQEVAKGIDGVKEVDNNITVK